MQTSIYSSALQTMVHRLDAVFGPQTAACRPDLRFGKSHPPMSRLMILPLRHLFSPLIIAQGCARLLAPILPTNKS